MIHAAHDARMQHARAAWHAMWRGDDGDVWAADPTTFLPFDRLALLRERAAIIEHWARRRGEYQLADDQWSLLASWSCAGELLLAAEVQFDLLPAGRTTMVERRLITLTMAFAYPDRPSVRHLGEATPAALVTMLTGYQREAQAR